MMCSRIRLIVFLFGMLGHAQTRPADLLRLELPLGERLSYGKGELQFGELRVPKGKGPHPVVMLIHGGCWVDRLPGADPRITTYALLRPLAEALTQAGLATWNVEYRRAGNAGGGWPGAYQDLGAAADFLRQVAPRFSLDLKSVVVAGHSAGGQLALWIAARSNLPRNSVIYANNPLPVSAAVNIDGPPDLAAAQPVERTFCPIDGITQFLGGTPQEQPARYREGTAGPSLPAAVPQWIFAGGLLDRQRTLVTGYEDAVRKSAGRLDIVRLEGANHFDMLDPASPHGQRLVKAIASLVNGKGLAGDHPLGNDP